ncbi:MAG: NAD(P)/FAD-dependent oxidoreductase, partial [Actinobacteria bacterium]|nr:NAD(P)/FAD-dependent oxidoreductase [Actinomycetota bacterium]
TLGVIVQGKKVVVIGSGIGGSGVAALLQHRGFEVTVLEKNKFYGGKCHSFERDGFVVDAGVHMYSRGPGGNLLEINREIGGNIKWLAKRNAVAMRIAGDRMMTAQSGIGGLLNMGRTATVKSSKGGSGTPSQSRSSKRVKGLSNELYKTLRMERSMFPALKLISNLVSCNDVLISDLDDISLRDFIHTFTDNRTFNQMMAYISMILTCTTYDRVSAGEVIWCVVKQFKANTLGVPEGSGRALPGNYLRCMMRDGGKLVLGAKAGKIKVDSGKVKSVVAADGKEYEADYVISNAGIKLTTAMVGEKNLPADYVKRVNGLEYSYSFITVKYGLIKKVLDFSGAPCFFNVPNMDPETMYDYLKTGDAPEDPHLFVPMQSEWDYTAAPLGQQLVIIGVLGPVTATKADAEHCKKIIDRADEKFESLYPGFKKYTQWSMRTDNSYYSQLTGKPTADCIGLAQTVEQAGVRKPSIKMPVEGLYLVGCDAGARGVGTDQAAGSAIAVANNIQ